VQAKGDFALENHIKFWEGLSFLNNCLVGDEHSAIQLADEERNEIVPHVQRLFLILKSKNVRELLLNEASEQLEAKFVP